MENKCRRLNQIIKDFDICQIKEFIKWSKNNSYNYWYDILDCSKSFQREKLDISFDDFCSKIDKNSYLTIILRKHVKDKYIEVTLSTMTDPDYFIWCQIDITNFEKLAQKIDRIINDNGESVEPTRQDIINEYTVDILSNILYEEEYDIKYYILQTLLSEFAVKIGELNGKK